MKNYMASIAVFCCAVGLFLYAVGGVSGKTVEEGAATLDKALHRASIQCYAIEGRYPPSVDYLAENYGVQIDAEKYVVFYEGFASNVMPDITVGLR